MPNKTNGIVYELYPRPTADEEGRPLLYAKAVVGHKYTIDDFDVFCARYRGTSRGDMKRLAELFQDVAAMWLSEGHRVETPFGSLAPKVRLVGDHADPANVTGRDIEYAGLEFIPSKEFAGRADCSLHGFRRKERMPWEVKKAEDEESLRRALRKSMFKGGYTTVKGFMDSSGLKRTTARRYLDSLCKGDNPLMISYLEGRTMHYALRDENADF